MNVANESLFITHFPRLPFQSFTSHLVSHRSWLVLITKQISARTFFIHDPMPLVCQSDNLQPRRHSLPHLICWFPRPSPHSNTYIHTRCRYNGIERGYQISRSNKFCPTANWLCLCDKLNWTHGRCVAVFVCVWKRQRRKPFRAGARAREHGAHANGEQWRRWWQWHLGFSLQLREEGYRLIFCGND